MKKNKNIFILSMPIITMAVCSLFATIDFASAASRTPIRTNSASRKPIVATAKKAVQPTPEKQNESVNIEPDVEQIVETVEDSEPETPLIIQNKSNQFTTTVSAVMQSASEDNSFAEAIRKQRAALAANEAKANTKSAQQNATATNSSSCDVALRKCMIQKCGSDFTGCALDGDTIFGDKLNTCKQDTTCSGQEFNLFSAEIKADRDFNVRMSSYNNVIECGNAYNACIMNECGTTYNKCLGKTAADAATQKCSAIAKDCMESDSGLAARFGTAIGKLRENAETDVKKDEERMYALRDLMRKQCQSLGASFDERTFDCIYSIEFYAGENQSVPTASRKRYAGDTFICMQEWFGINATTFKENAYRETRSQTAASSAMLGSGLGTAAGIISSGALDRALETQKAKKEYKEECEKTAGKKWQNGKCVDKTDKDIEKDENKENKRKQKECEKQTDYEWKDGQCVRKTANSGPTTPSSNDGSVAGNNNNNSNNNAGNTNGQNNNPSNATGTGGQAGTAQSDEAPKEEGKESDKTDKSGECAKRGGTWKAGSCWCKGKILGKDKTCDVTLEEHEDFSDCTKEAKKNDKHVKSAIWQNNGSICYIQECDNGWKLDDTGSACIKDDTNTKSSDKPEKCAIENALTTKRDANGTCKVISCKPGFVKINDYECSQNKKTGTKKPGKNNTKQPEQNGTAQSNKPADKPIQTRTDDDKNLSNLPSNQINNNIQNAVNGYQLVNGTNLIKSSSGKPSKTESEPAKASNAQPDSFSVMQNLPSNQINNDIQNAVKQTTKKSGKKKNNSQPTNTKPTPVTAVDKITDNILNEYPLE